MREVDKDRRTQIITLSIKWKDPTLAAKWTNNLVRRLNDHARNRAIEEGQRAIGYLNEQIGKTSVVEMQQALFKLVEAQQKRIMLATIRQEYAFQVLDPALEPQERSSPRRTLMVLAGITIGGLLGMLAVLMRKYVFSRS
jgi:uncharacterized protein involved in exopolysaccharide biosynthesis